MRISQVQIVESDGKARLSALVSHEAIEKPEQEIFFEVDLRYKRYLRDVFEPFLLACFPAALFHGEERIRVEGQLCPELAANVKAALLLQKYWWGDRDPIPRIECQSHRILDTTHQGTACFISGGVDSLSNFCRNILLYGQGDHRRIKYGLFVYGMDIGDPNKMERKDIFEAGKEKLCIFLASKGCELIPIYTNARNVEIDWRFYEERHHGALLGGIAHALSGGFSHCHLALDFRSDFYHEWGSHPWLNKYFSSSGLVVNSTMDSYSRIEKYYFLEKIPAALNVLRVCHTVEQIPVGELNCCKCSKCMRTKVELLVQGLLDQAVTFSDKSIMPELVRTMRVQHRHDLEFLGEPIGRLREHGQNAIADYLQQQVDAYLRGPSFKEKIIEKIKYADRTYLNGRLRSMIRKREHAHHEL